MTKIDKWFLYKLFNIHKNKIILSNLSNTKFSLYDPENKEINKELILKSKKLGMSDKLIAKLLNLDVNYIRNYRYINNIIFKVKQIDTTEISSRNKLFIRNI